MMHRGQVHIKPKGYTPPPPFVPPEPGTINYMMWQATRRMEEQMLAQMTRPTLFSTWLKNHPKERVYRYTNPQTPTSLRQWRMNRYARR